MATQTLPREDGLLKRLRYWQSENGAPLFGEAADEIERLREELRRATTMEKSLRVSDEAERAVIVAWLRERDEQPASYYASAIERGEHCRAQEDARRAEIMEKSLRVSDIAAAEEARLRDTPSEDCRKY